MNDVNKITKYLNRLFSNPKCALDFSSDYEMLVAVVLSAQCTDKRVNIVTKELFSLANTPEKMLALGIDRLKDIIHSCGFYNAKSKAIISLSEDLITKFNGQVPRTMAELTSLRGVGRKTANVVLGVAFGEQTIAVDTHVLRICKRLNLTSKHSDPNKCEQDLMKILPNNIWTRFHHQAIWFGREVCSAVSPKCDRCELKDICTYYKGKN